MIFHESVISDCIQLEAELQTKEDVLKEISSLAVRSPYLENMDKEKIFKALKNRESLASTGFGGGIAVPHCSFPDIEDFTVGVLTLSAPVDFKAIDKQKVDIFFFIIGPENQRNKHIQILSGISKFLGSRDSIESLRKMRKAEELAAFLGKEEKPAVIKDDDYEKCIFNIMVQDEKYFNDILEILSSEPDTYISVVDSNNAGYYLKKQPLFSAFWTESESYFNKLIMAVTRKSYCNNIIRRINIIDDKPPTESRVLINVQDLFYSKGSIDF